MEGGRGVSEIVTICDKGSEGVTRSVTSHILVKIKTFKISRLDFEVNLKLPNFEGIFLIGATFM